MKTLTAAIFGAVALAWSAYAVAADAKPGYRTAKSNHAVQHRARHKKPERSATAQGGDCGLRDHAAPLGSFADSCNSEEFWRRMQDRAPSPE